ncbi:hypothetical protein [Acinetobacter bereziniae]|uniref:hypothetical protein n=1 Tax=Acinetobacter bereziniae TaxID=106648 RepID=UPI0015D9EE45|nr:hypothetical protein [Acinetobacter bereziniae]
MINLSPSHKKFFKIDSKTNEEIELEHVSEQNNLLFTSMKTIVCIGDSIKIIDVDGYEEIRKVKQSGKEFLRQKIVL